MAYVSMIFAYIVVFVILLSAMAVIGLTLLIVGIIIKKKSKFSGKKSPIICIASGVTLIIIPLIATVLLIFNIITSAFPNAIENFDRENTVIESVADEWRNGFVTDSKAAYQAINALLEAADSGDREAFGKIFTPNIQKRSDFTKTVNAFFETYPKGLAKCERDGGQVGSSSSFRSGNNVQTGSTHYICTLNGEWHIIYLGFCYENTLSPDDVGVTMFYIENLEANALSYSSDSTVDDDLYLYCKIVDESEVCARLIGDRGYVFTPTPERIITEAQIRDYMEKYDDMKLLIAEIGEPNAAYYSDHSIHEARYIYELAPENSEPRYVRIAADRITNEIYYCYICSDKETLYDKGEFPENDESEN